MIASIVNTKQKAKGYEYTRKNIKYQDLKIYGGKVEMSEKI